MDIYIKQAAKRHGLTQQEVMTRAGYHSKTSFSRTINNPESMTLRTLLRIADAIGCPLAEFFTPAEQGEQGEQRARCPWCGKPIRVQLEQGEDSAFRTK